MVTYQQFQELKRLEAVGDRASKRLDFFVAGNYIAIPTSILGMFSDGMYLTYSSLTISAVCSIGAIFWAIYLGMVVKKVKAIVDEA